MGQLESTTRTHVVLPEQVVREIDSLVGKRSRSAFLTEAATRELRRIRLLRALDVASGSWKDEDHPELKGGATRWVAKLRREDEFQGRRRRK